MREVLAAQTNHAAMVGAQAVIYESITEVVEVIHNFMRIGKKGKSMHVDAPANPCCEDQKMTHYVGFGCRSVGGMRIDILRSREIRTRNRGEQAIHLRLI